MRVTNKMLSNSFLTDMTNNMNNLQRIQKQMATQKEINKASDDPVKATRIMELYTNIDANIQFNSNIKDASSFLDTTDAALGQCGNVLGRVRDLLVSAGNGTYSPDERNAIKDELNVKIGELTQIMNTSFDGKYIFGGSRVDVKPVTTITNKDATNGAVTNIKASGLPGTTTATVSTTASPAGPTVDTIYKIVLLGANGSNVDISSSTDGGTTFTSVATNVTGTGSGSGYDYTFGNNLKINIQNNPTNGNGDNFTFAATAANPLNNTKLVYNSDNISAPELVSTSDMANNTGNGALNQIDAKLSVEVSQGVNIQYSVSATDVFQFKNATGVNRDLRQILSGIVNHLDGKNADGTAVTVADPNPTLELNKTDLTAITDTINNLLSLRAQVGAKQNRMESAGARNETENGNLTEILSKTEDIDITQKSIDYASAQTVYTAALQTSAKIIQPSLLDFLR